MKKVFLKIWQENTCVKVSFLIKLQAEPCDFIKKRLQHRCFPVNFARFLIKPFYRTSADDCFCSMAMYVN